MAEALQLDKDEIESMKNIFYAQAFQLMRATRETIRKYSDEPRDTECIEKIKRYIHTLKGDASIIGLDDVSLLCYKIEELLSLLDKNESVIDRDSLQFFSSCVEQIEKSLKESQSGSSIDGIKHVISQIDHFMKLHK